MLHPKNLGAEGAYVTVNERPHGGHAKLLAQVDGGGRVLDVGCSTGYLSRLLVERGSTVVGIELDEEAAAQARRFCETVLTGDVERMELPFEPASFDAVMCADLIEHLREPGAFIARVRPLLRPGGRLVLTTPNVANWTIRLALLFGRFDYTERGILDRTHTHLFTRRSLIRCLEGAGYHVESFDFTVPVPGVGTPRVEALAHAIGRLRPSLFAFQFVVAATPR
jgi:2-polyprenyl-3-methyl-5-hydroxy-6-metoxy-1,4-benzoquinol methylase